MMNLNANLTTLASRDGELDTSNPSIEGKYLKAAGICIAAEGGVAFHMVQGKQVPTADTLSIAKILQNQGSQKNSWQPTYGQSKESAAVNKHTYFSPENAAVDPQYVGKAADPQDPPTIPLNRHGRARRSRTVKWSTNQTKFFKAQRGGDNSVKEHNAPRSACTWNNTHLLNVGSLAVDMDVSEIGVAGYFSSVEPLQGQKARMTQNLKTGNSILRDRLLAHSKDFILQQFQFCGRVHPLREPSGLIGTSLPEPLQEYLPDSRFKNQSAFLSPLSSSVQFDGPICQQDDVDIYLVQVHPRNNRKIKRDLDNALEDEVVDSMSVSSYGSCGSKANMRHYRGQAKLRMSLHTSYQAPEGCRDSTYRFAFALRGAPDMDDTHADPGIASLQSWDLSQVVADTHRLLRAADRGKNTSFAARGRITLQRVEIRAAKWEANVQVLPAITETWVIVQLHHCLDGQGNCPYLGTIEELTEFVRDNLAEGGIFYAAGLPLCYTEVKPDPDRHDEPFYAPLPSVFQSPAGLLTIRNIHENTTAEAAITALSEAGLDLARLTHTAIRRTPQVLTGIGRIPGLVATGDYSKEIELRFQGAPPPLYELSFTKLKSSGMIRNNAPEGDVWAWHDTPGLNLIRQYVCAEVGLIPYKAAALTGLLNEPREGRVQAQQAASKDQPWKNQNRNGGRINGGRGPTQGRGRGRGHDGARGRGGSNQPATLDEVKDQLAQLIADNASLRADNAKLIARLTADEHRAAQHFSLADVYAGEEEENIEYNQEDGSIGIKAAAARQEGRTEPGNDTKRAKTGPPGERRPPR